METYNFNFRVKDEKEDVGVHVGSSEINNNSNEARPEFPEQPRDRKPEPVKETEQKEETNATPDVSEKAEREDAEITTDETVDQEADDDENDGYELLAPIAEENTDGESPERYTNLHTSNLSLKTTPSPKVTTPPSPQRTKKSMFDPVSMQSNTSLFDNSFLESSTSLFDGVGIQTDRDDNCILLGPADVIYCDPKTEL